MPQTPQDFAQAVQDILRKIQAPPYSFSEDAARQIVFCCPEGVSPADINLDNWKEYSSPEEAVLDIVQIFSISQAEVLGCEKEFLKEQRFFEYYELPMPNGGALINYAV